MSEINSLFDLSGRTVLVTGGAGLLGAQFCRTLAQAGAHVLAADANLQAAEALCAALSKQGCSAAAVQVDVRSPESTVEMVRTAVERWGSLDVLVNSAALDPKFDPGAKGGGARGAFEDFPLEAWQQALDVNLTGVFLCCQAAVKPMLDQGRGVIINIASMYGVVAPDQRLYERDGEAPDERRFKPVYYTATKAGVLGMTQYLAAYYAGKNIRVNALTPGGVYNGHDEQFLRRYAARSVMRRMAQADEMNGALLFLASDASSYMTGANLIVDGGWSVW